MKSTILWDITPGSPLKLNRRFGETYGLHLQGRKQAGVISHKIVLFKQVIGIPHSPEHVEGFPVHTPRHLLRLGVQGTGCLRKDL
jgi:hypothetical protein